MYDDKIAILRDRAAMLARSRRFFRARNITEVDCPSITASASVDAHIDLMPVLYTQNETRYLHSSPEYGMKRLIAQGIGDIFQLAHVFRDGEYSHKHNPEFTMAEWYRIGIAFADMITETLGFIRLFLGNLPSKTLSYREMFHTYAKIDYHTATERELIEFLHTHNIETYPELVKEGKDAILNIILGTIIEPQLGQDELFVLAYYPASQAALAQTKFHGDEQVAERFEVYYQGVELANGYHELANAKEQRKRLEEANSQRKALGKKILPIDEFFLNALEKGLPDCCGVAVGFDRLMMLRHNRKFVADVIPFEWTVA